MVVLIGTTLILLGGLVFIILVMTKKIELPFTEPKLKCPRCKCTGWIEGPGGGSFGNITCSNCRTKYNNLGPFGLEEIGKD